MANKKDEPVATAVVVEETIPAPTELVIPENKTVAIPIEFDFQADANKGLENIGVNEIQIPLVYLLQTLSPVCNKKKDQYVEGAEPGMLFNNVSEKFYNVESGDYLFVPCAYKKVFVEWKPDLGGFAGEHQLSEGLRLLTTCKKGEKGENILPNKNLLSETAYHYGLIITPEGKIEWSVLPMSNTKLKASKKLNTLCRTIKFTNKDGAEFTPPLFANCFNIKTVLETKNNNDYYIYKFTYAKKVDDINVYNTAKQFYEAIETGIAKFETTDTDIIVTEEETSGLF